MPPRTSDTLNEDERTNQISTAAALIDAHNNLVDIVGGDRPRAGQRGVVVDRGYDRALVRDIQTELAAQGHYRCAIDCLFGDGTRGAVLDYQTAQGLLTGYPKLQGRFVHAPLGLRP